MSIVVRFLALVALVLLAAPLGAAERAFVERIRYVGTVSYSRVVVDLSRAVPHRVQIVPADEASGSPLRVVVDVDGARIGPEAKEPLSIGDALLRRIRTGQFTRDTARIVLDLARDADYRVFTLPDPHRLVVDLRTESGGPAAVSDVVRLDSSSSRAPQGVAPPPAVVEPPAPEPRAPPAVASRSHDADPRPAPVARSAPRETASRAPLPAAARKFKVMIDPGHGGKDPGARGVGGLHEKDVVLSISRLLEERLREDPTMEVHLTRRDDRYLSLEERTALANAVGADLFVSIHANASHNREARGIEVYYLNNTNNRGTLRLAAMENDVRWDPGDPGLSSAIPDLSYILSDLRQTYKVEESKTLAEELVSAMEEEVRHDYPGAKGLGAKEGPFYVLVGAHMPCVLVETSFLTHPVEGARLKTLSYRRALAEGILSGIRTYLSRTTIAGTL